MLRNPNEAVPSLLVAASLAAAWYYLPLFALLGWFLVTSLLCLRPHSTTPAR